MTKPKAVGSVSVSPTLNPCIQPDTVFAQGDSLQILGIKSLSRLGKDRPVPAGTIQSAPRLVQKIQAKRA
ncbi:MAG: hypothetical protein FJY53_07165 [Betaproteobacteria bacterium]|nr:hypothetical protein [Betaproteobacteria bacterium]